MRQGEGRRLARRLAAGAAALSISAAISAAALLGGCVGRKYSRKSYDQGIEAAQAGDTAAAIRHLASAAKAHRNNGDAHYERGLLLWDRGDTADAIASLANAAASLDDPYKAHVALAKAHAARGDAQASLAHARRAGGQRPGDHRAAFLAMQALLAQNDPQAAVDLFMATPGSALDARMNYARGLALERQGNTAGALAGLALALRQDSALADAMAPLARMLAQNGMADSALAVATRCADLHDLPQCHQCRLEAFAAKLDWHNAISVATTLYNATGDRAYLLRRARYHQFTGLLNNALNDYAFILASDPDNTTALFYSALIHDQLRDERQVARQINRFLRLADTATPQWQVNRARELADMLSREVAPPEITLEQPPQYHGAFLGIDHRADTLRVRGTMAEQARISTLTVNGAEIELPPSRRRGVAFQADVPFPADDSLRVQATDIYGNTTTFRYALVEREQAPPELLMIAPRPDTAGNAPGDTRQRAVRVRFLAADKNLLARASVNGIACQIAPGSRTALVDTLAPLADDNTVAITIADIFGNQKRTTFTIADNGTAGDIDSDSERRPDLLAVVVEGKRRAGGVDGAALADMLRLAGNASVTHLRGMDKRALERFLLLDLPGLASRGGHLDLLVWLHGDGVEEDEAAYWFPEKCDTARKPTWFNLAFLASSTRALSLPGTAVYVTGGVFPPARMLDTASAASAGNIPADALAPQAMVAQAPAAADSLSTARFLGMAHGAKSDLTGQALRLAPRTGWLREFGRKRPLPVMLFWRGGGPASQE